MKNNTCRTPGDRRPAAGCDADRFRRAPKFFSYSYPRTLSPPAVTRTVCFFPRNRPQPPQHQQFSAPISARVPSGMCCPTFIKCSGNDVQICRSGRTFSAKVSWSPPLAWARDRKPFNYRRPVACRGAQRVLFTRSFYRKTSCSQATPGRHSAYTLQSS